MRGKKREDVLKVLQIQLVRRKGSRLTRLTRKVDFILKIGTGCVISNPELAGFLLNSHYESQKRCSSQGILSSTPARPHPLPRISELILSEISSTDTKGNGSTTETAESGVEELSEKSIFLAQLLHLNPKRKKQREKVL